MKRRFLKAWNKKHKQLPTKPCLDPFLNIVVKINKNGRYIGFINGRWQVIKPSKKGALYVA